MKKEVISALRVLDLLDLCLLRRLEWSRGRGIDWSCLYRTKSLRAVCRCLKHWISNLVAAGDCGGAIKLSAVASALCRFPHQKR